MKTTDLRTALGSLVEKHGFRKVSRLLRELEPAPVSTMDTPSASNGRTSS